MRTLDWAEFLDNAPHNPPAAMTVGVFDGVHLGHQRLIRRVVEYGACPTAVSFTKNPKQVLHPRSYPGDIITLDEKLRIFEDLGVEQTVLIDFSDTFRRMKGREFIELLIDKGNLAFLVVGGNFRCGWKLDTDASALCRITASRGAVCEIAAPVTVNGERVSSSAVRAAIRAGDYTKARLFLGRDAVFTPIPKN
jgi:riboflavin kinase/FMN adenylyltransferase